MPPPPRWDWRSVVAKGACARRHVMMAHPPMGWCRWRLWGLEAQQDCARRHLLAALPRGVVQRVAAIPVAARCALRSAAACRGLTVLGVVGLGVVVLGVMEPRATALWGCAAVAALGFSVPMTNCAMST